MTNKRQYLKRSDSRAPLRSYALNKDWGTIFPDFSFEAVRTLINSDPVARGALNHFVDKCMEADYAIVKKDSLDYDREFELKLDEEYKFRHEILRKGFTIAKLYNNAFFEVARKADGNIKSLNVLDSSIVDVITKTNGDPIKYKAKMPDPVTGQYAEWSTKDIAWLKMGDISQGWAPVDMRALYENLQTKQYVKHFVAWLWKTGQYRLMYNFKTASTPDISDFLSYLRQNDENFRAPGISKGELETRILRPMEEMRYIHEYQKYLDSQTLILLRIPPIDAGIPDASGRSNSDAQSNNLATHVQSYQKAMEDVVSFDLFPKINKGNNLLRFAPVDRFAEAQLWEIIAKMRNAGVTEEFIREYMNDHGIFMAAKSMFEKPEKADVRNPSTGEKDIDEMPSREGKMTGEANDAVGTGEQSTSRPDQVGEQ
jgi:hypothetical protein